jgi:RNA polymerase sigma factor (sigma-70 family)
MSSDGSVTGLLGPLQAGDPAAVEQLWQRYFPRLAGLARTKLPGSVRRIADEEDVACSALASFCRHAGEGRFPEVRDRDSLWRLLVVITSRKAAHQVRDQTCRKRGDGEVGSLEDDSVFRETLSREPTPELAAQMEEEYQRLLGALPEEQRQVAVLKMEGHSNAEIAGQLGVADRTVKRRLESIRKVWRDRGGG